MTDSQDVKNKLFSLSVTNLCVHKDW